MSGRSLRVGLLAAADDRMLFGLELWPMQRELLAAVDEGPRMHVLALGRRSGKTTMAAVVCLWDCLLRPELGRFMRPGERRHAVAVATNLRQSRLIVRTALSIVERSPALAELVETVTEDEITFATGTALTAFPCNSRGGRGWPISCLALDEFAHFMTETDGPQVADRVLEALVPSTAQFAEHARVIVSSTPWGSSGLFADLFRRAQSGELEDAVAQHASTAEANPTIDAAFLEHEQARDPEGFKSEYLAEFVGGGAAFLDAERIADAVADRGELPPSTPGMAVAGLDPAFSSDPFGLAIVTQLPPDPKNPGGTQLALALARAWRPARAKPASFEERRAVEDTVLAEVADVCKQYRARVVTDQYAAPAIVDALRRRGLSVKTVPMTAMSKTAAFTELRARLYTGSLELYDEPGLLAELRRLRSKYTAGQASVVNPRVGGSHGDIAQALALAVFEHDRHGTTSWTPSDGAGGLPRGRSLREKFGATDEFDLRPGMSL